jgi:ribosomal protein L11 methyltransferase
VAYFVSLARARRAARILRRGRVGALVGDGWADAWKKFARARRFGRLVVAPHFKRLRLRRGDCVVRLDPGRAFGTGSHPTTALCLAWIAARVSRGDRVLDVGTGSGVLAIAAAKCGAGRVVAVDVDPDAVATARENARANGVSLRLAVGTAADVQGRFDVVLANLTAEVLVGSAATLRARLAKSGRLVASGILACQVAAVRAEIGLTSEVARRGEWRRIVFR